MKFIAGLALQLVVCSASAVTIAPYELPLGVSVTELNDYEQNQKARQDKDNQGIRRSEKIYLRQLTRVAESKRLTKFDEWILIYLVDDKTLDGGSRGFQQYTRADHSKTKVRYYLEKDELVITSVDGTAIEVSDEVRDTIENLARRQTFVDKLVRQTSGRNWTVGESRQYTGQDAHDTFGAEHAELSLSDFSTRWEKSVAEFRLQVRFENGLSCDMSYLVLAEQGRPINVNSRCHLKRNENGVDFYYDEVGSRAFAYNDLPISRLSPTPVLAQQPKGKVLDAVFSNVTEQLAFLTQDYASNTNWLTLWDLNQRKIVRSQRQPGDSLLLSGNEETLFAMGNNRIHQAWLKVSNKYQAFGYAADMNIEDHAQIVDSTLLGLYPITLNAGGELEIWNLGYSRIIERLPITIHQAEKLSVNTRGELLTANRNGEFALHRIALVPSCESTIDSAYCDVIDVTFDEATTVQSIPLGLDKGLGSVELAPSGHELVYCSEFPATCGYIDLKGDRHQSFAYARNAIFDRQGQVVLDTATFNVETLEEKPYDPLSFASFYPGMAVSKERNVRFNIRPRMDHITDHEIVVRDNQTGAAIGTIKRSVYPVRSLVVFDESNLGYFSNSYGLTQLNVVDTSALAVEQATYPFSVDSAEIINGWMVLSSQDLLMVNHMENKFEPKLFKFAVSDYALTDDYLFYARESTIVQYHLETGDEEVLYSFDSPVNELLVLNAEQKQFVARLNHGVFALPHLNKRLELPFQGGFTKALAATTDGQSFFVSGLVGYSSAYNPSIEVLQQFNTAGEPMQEMEPQWGKSQVMLATRQGYLWNGDDSGDLTIRDVQSGLIVEVINAHQGSIVDIKALNDKTIVTASTDGSVKFWRQDHLNGKFHHKKLGVAHPVFVAPDIAQRQLRLKSTLIVDVNGGHVMNTPDGYYWASPKALHDASFLNNDEIFDYARFDFWLNRPDIVSNRLSDVSSVSQQQWKKMVEFRQGRHPTRPRHIPLQSPDFEFKLAGPSQIGQKANIELKWSTNKTAKSLHVFVNQVPIYGQQGLDISESTGDRLNLDLVPGVNRIKAFVQGDGDLPSETRYLTYEGNPEQEPDLYLLAVGVSDYQLDRLDLDYAAKDATDIASALSKSTTFKNVHTKFVLDAEATSEGILSARDFLEQASSIDTVVVFFAGHGLLDVSNNYYFGTTNIDPDDPAAKGLGYSEMSGLLDGLRARQKLMLMDTCYSGEVTEAARPIELPEGVASRGLSFATEEEVDVSHTMLQKTFVDLRASTGAIVISAAGGREYALEREEIKNGIFTASFIKGLLASDQNSDGKVTVSELRTFTYDEVERLSGGAQRPTTRKHNLDVDFEIF